MIVCRFYKYNDEKNKNSQRSLRISSSVSTRVCSVKETKSFSKAVIRTTLILEIYKFGRLLPPKAHAESLH